MNTEYNIVKFVPTESLNEKHIKDDNMHKVFNVVAYDNQKQFSNPITVKIYRTKNTNYLCFWLQNKAIIASGSENFKSIFNIGGALQIALRNAGIEFDKSFGGRDDSSIHQSLSIIMKYMGYNEFYIFQS